MDLPPPQISVNFVGPRLRENAQRQVSTLVWACLDKQKYVDGSEARVFVEERERTYYIEASAREPGGPIIRLIDVEIPHEGVAEDQFADYLQANGLSAERPEGVVRIATNFQQPATPRPPTTPKVGRNEPCTCGSGKKAKRCCLN
jgi:hypothetical protein